MDALMQSQQNQHELDAKRLLCPLPVIRTQDKVKLLKPGDTLTIYCTDPGTIHDIPTWCRINGHKVIDITHKERDIIIKIAVGNE